MDKIQENNFLQSAEWLKFQENTGRKTHRIESEGFSAGIIEHKLPIVGRYFYAPRWPSSGFKIQNSKFKILFSELLEIAKKNNAGWIRIDPEDEIFLELIKKNTDYRIAKAPHDMQPKEIFVIDISKSEEELLAEMKSKTRYNIGIAKKNIKVVTSSKGKEIGEKYIEEFLRLTKEMAKRQGISTHPEKYYRKMFESLPEDMLKLYCAEYEDRVIAANLVLFFGNTATYLHGASSNDNRNLMAPYLLQWQAILDAKNRGCMFYDFGGISTNNEPKTMNWHGITKFKLGFSPDTKPVVFPGSYDIVINLWKYRIYRILQKIKSIL